MRAPVLLAAAVLAWATGCASLKAPPPPIHEYLLDYPSPRVEGEPLPVVLRLAPFGTAAAYDRAGIVYRNGEFETGAYFYERWAAYPAKMIGDLLARDFARSGLYDAVEQGASTLPVDYDLSAQIDEIEEHRGVDGCTARIRIRALLSRSRAARTSRVVFQKTYSASEACSGGSIDGVVAAMSAAMGKISVQVQRDVYQAIAADRKAEAPPPEAR